MLKMGLMAFGYRASRWAWVGFHASLVTFLIPPRVIPAGETQGSDFTQSPAVSALHGTQRNTLLYRSSMYFQFMSMKVRSEAARPLIKLEMLVTSEPGTFTTSL